MKRRCLLLTLLALTGANLFSTSPATVTEAWKDYNPRKDPLKTEVIKEWDNDDGHFKLVRYSIGKLVGSNKSAEPMIAAYYGYPKGKKNVPAIVQIHGGGQRAYLRGVEHWVKMGYACISINWGALVIEQKDTPNTDWDGLAAGFVGNRDQKHYNPALPGVNTLYKENHPFNSSWMLIAMAARRAITFLEEQPEVDKTKIGVEGHSMGGRSTVFTAIDPRLKAASPSVGGSGYLVQDMWGLKGSARHMTEGKKYYETVISCQNYWPLIKCPVMFLEGTNDFNAPMDLVIKGMSKLPESTVRVLAAAPHLNHRFTTSTAAARYFWMEANLKQNMKFPKTSKAEIILNPGDGIPLFKVWPDKSSGLKIEKVEIYYGYARDPRIRFWRDAQAKKVGNHYKAKCPVFDTNEPLFAFANVTYNAGRTIPMPPGHTPTNQVTITSDYKIIYPDMLKKAGVKASEKQQRLIDDFSRGWQDWYRLSWNNPHHWFYSTRKLVDPSWMGPENGKLAFDIITTAPGNKLAVVMEVNNWQGYTGRRRDTYYAIVDVPKSGKNSVKLSVSDFANAGGQKLKIWNETTELQFYPANKARVKWAPKDNWKGNPPKLANLRWEGGTFDKVLHPHQKRTGSVSGKAVSFDKEFQDSIKDSVKLEQMDEKASAGGKLYLTKELATKNNSFWRVMNNKSVVGQNKISISGKTYDKGIGVHADSTLVYSLNGKFKTFHVIPGPDDAHKGMLEMKILVDGKEVYNSGKVRSVGFKSKELNLDVTGAKTLSLIVTKGDASNGGDHASWADAYLTK